MVGTNVTAVVSPDRAECVILDVILAVRFFASSGRMVGEPLCDVGIWS